MTEGNSVFTVNLAHNTIQLLKWYITKHKIYNTQGKKCTMPQAVESMMTTFVDDVVKKEMEDDCVDVEKYIELHR